MNNREVLPPESWQGIVSKAWDSEAENLDVSFAATAYSLCDCGKMISATLRVCYECQRR